MASRNRTSDFLRAMNPEIEPAVPEASAPAESRTVLAANQSVPTEVAAKRPKPIVQKKHIGAYLDKETVEKFAMLRARLEMDNSELIKFAIEELHRKQMAKRAFGDA